MSDKRQYAALHRLIAVAVVAMLPAMELSAQANLSLNASDELAYDVFYHNPAGMAFVERAQGAIGMQLLHTGVSGDNLRSTLANYGHALGGGRALGARAIYFNSNLLQQGSFSLLLAQNLFDETLGVGVNANLLTISYDRGSFSGFDENDPLLARGTNKHAFSFGLGLLWQPMWPLSLGASVDHLNQPDVSLDHSGFKKSALYTVGVSYKHALLTPQLDLRIVESDVQVQGAVRSRLLDQRINVMVGYNAGGSEASTFFTELNFTHGQFGLSYNLQYPLNDLNQFSSGTHRLTILFGEGGIPRLYARPSVTLFAPEESATDASLYEVAGNVSGTDGVTGVEIIHNGRRVVRESFERSTYSFDLRQPIRLMAGENRIEVIGRAGRAKRSNRIAVTFLPPQPPTVVTAPLPEDTLAAALTAPKIVLVSPSEDRFITSRSVIRLDFSAGNVMSTDDVVIKINNEQVSLAEARVVQRTTTSFEVRYAVDLQEGENRIELHAFGPAGYHNHDIDVLYNPMADSSPYRQTWAVVIGIDDYRDPFIKDLSFAVTDARAIESLLRETFHVDRMIALYNQEATKARILAVLGDSLRATGPDDRVFIFFAGHGYTETVNNELLGYLVPYDGAWDSYAQNISMKQLQETALIPKARHIFYAMDACYSGLLLTTRGADLRPKEEIDYRALWNLASNRSRFVLTAGQQDQEVLDGGRGQHSFFTSRLLEGLQGAADANGDYHVTATELSTYVRAKVIQDAEMRRAKQVPDFGRLTTDDGEVVFERAFK